MSEIPESKYEASDISLEHNLKMLNLKNSKMPRLKQWLAGEKSDAVYALPHRSTIQQKLKPKSNLFQDSFVVRSRPQLKTTLGNRGKISSMPLGDLDTDQDDVPAPDHSAGRPISDNPANQNSTSQNLLDRSQTIKLNPKRGDPKLLVIRRNDLKAGTIYKETGKLMAIQEDGEGGLPSWAIQTDDFHNPRRATSRRLTIRRGLTIIKQVSKTGTGNHLPPQVSAIEDQRISGWSSQARSGLAFSELYMKLRPSTMTGELVSGKVPSFSLTPFSQGELDPNMQSNSGMALAKPDLTNKESQGDNKGLISNSSRFSRQEKPLIRTRIEGLSQSKNRPLLDTNPDLEALLIPYFFQTGKFQTSYGK